MPRDAGDPLDMDADPTGQVCTPDETYCEGQVLQTCAGDGSGPIAGQEQTCEFICGVQGTAQCLYASNVPSQVYDECAAGGHALQPTTGTVTITEPTEGFIHISCSNGCGSANTIEAARVVEGDSAWFCLTDVQIASGVDVVHDGSIEESVIWLVESGVEIAGSIQFGGGDADEDDRGGRGPGGHRGAGLSSGPGLDGEGPCPGQGGEQRGFSTNWAAGGGGGAGHAGSGGAGGVGQDPFPIKHPAAGGGGGGTCGQTDLIPLLGGSGGASGADGTCGVNCGWPGGGGGGALQISARDGIEITGRLDASGGAGYGTGGLIGRQGGAGGGGSGGALLLESATVAIAGQLIVDGGAGGRSAVGDGGAGASGEQLNGAEGTSATSSNPSDGGAGGGGASGRIRLNTLANTLSCGGFASPSGACSNGELSTNAP